MSGTSPTYEGLIDLTRRQAGIIGKLRVDITLEDWGT
jgi:hypothetical protein